MYRPSRSWSFDYILVLTIFFLTLISIGVLRSILPSLFPLYFLYTAGGIVFYLIFLRVDFKIITAFYKHIYVFCIVLLLLPLLIGEITRGAVRWIPIGPVAIQPSELVRPFLILSFAAFLTAKELTFQRIIKSGLLLALPAFLIIIQPSLGVATLTVVAFLGVLLASTFDKRYILSMFAAAIILAPAIWFFMAPYQQTRLITFLNPQLDPLGAGYNSIQSMISVGSGKIFGRGLGQGVQTQLSFLPERHNDFIFASIAEEMGLIGVLLLLACLFALLWRITRILEIAKSPTARAYVSGVFLVMFFQVVFNIGMNMGLFPITGIPLPLVSAGGSSFIATMISLGIVNNSKR